MKLFINIDFESDYAGQQSAAVVIAEDSTRAAKLLNKSLRDNNMQAIQKACNMREISTDKEVAYILAGIRN